MEPRDVLDDLVERLRPVLFVVRGPLVSLLAVGAVTVALLGPAGTPSAASLATPAPTETTAPTPAPSPTPTPITTVIPDRIAMPTLGVEAPIVEVGIESDGAMGTPSNGRDVAWWEGMPAGLGNALFAGHKDWRGARGSFYDLRALEVGDPVVVSGDGGTLTFRVAWVEQVDADSPRAPEILGDVGRPVVTLITCGGPFDRSVRHYTERVIARAVLEA